MLIAAYAGTVAGFVVYIRGRDQREQAERAQLLNRIQAPEMTAAQSVVETTEAPEKLYASVYSDQELEDEFKRLGG